MTTPTLKTVNLLDNDSFNQYCSAALWSSTDDDGIPLDNCYDLDDIDEESLELHREQCQTFIQTNYSVILELRESGYDLGTILTDFWLTRNGHGCGFWDGDYPEPAATQLTNSAHSFGEVDPYVGDDGLVYLS